MFPFKFNDLIKEDNFQTIKYFFLIDDKKNIKQMLIEPEAIVVDYNCDEIETVLGLDYKKLNSENFNLDEICKTHKTKKLNFYTDEVIPAINEMYENYKKDFISEMDNRNIFESSGIENFSKKYLIRIEKNKLDLLKVSHLRDDIKKMALNVADKIYHFVSNEFYQNYFKIPQKIPFNLNKNQLIVFFHLLYENGIISEEIKPTDLSRLIEQYCTYYDRESNSYLDVKRARDLEIRIFKQDEEPNPEPSIKHLESIFFNNKFYDYE